MSDNDNFGFGKLVPGFDFLQNIAKGASQMPSLSNWVAPTLNPEELEKRIGELKAVHFWLDQNSKALGATIQALEVQKMTLATLKGMNFNMGEVANAFKLKMPESTMTGAQKVSERTAPTPKANSVDADTSKAAADSKSEKAGGQPAAGIVDPLQWWGALTQQFQQIAAGALKDAAAQTAAGAAKNAAAGMAKEAFKTAGTAAAKTAVKSTTGSARKTATKRAAPKK
jgi:hypothetical protein